MVEDLRKQYAGKVTFVARYFPLPGHFNGERAARAVEAAAQQGKFEAMYQRMYETQTQWGEKQTPADAAFRSFAQDLGLDMAAWDKAYNDPATLARINKDVAETFQEIRRVLRPGGEVRFYEHQRSNRWPLALLSGLMTPLRSRAAGGCHPARDILAEMEQAGFGVESLDRFAVRGFEHVVGVARPR